jgi:hypothetical protein
MSNRSSVPSLSSIGMTGYVLAFSSKRHPAHAGPKSRRRATPLI